MRTPLIINLPGTSRDYSESNEQITRRTIEQSFQDLRNDMIEVRDTSDKSSSLALRRHQFLLMGA